MKSSNKSLSILFIAPLPPPLTGHSIADQLLLERIKDTHKVGIVNLSIGSNHNGTVSFQRICAVINVLRKVIKLRKAVDVAYLTISESIAGNLKDLMILWLLQNKAGRIVLHLHGGSFRVDVLERSWLLRKINKNFFSKVDKVIITGKSHEEIFQGIVAPSRITIVPNFALQSLFTTEQKIRQKFENIQSIRILYVSGMDLRKGYARLLEAYLALPATVRARLRLDFAGRFDDPIEQADFEARIASLEDITYHGVVDGERKRDLFNKAHIFCLPTAYREGQPLTVLEAYASGCVVLTTPQPGILDIFEPGVNGQLVSPDDTVLLQDNLEKITISPSQLLDVALTNFEKSTKNYRAEIFCERMINILEAC